MKLEELARQSADAARASVVHLDPPAIGEQPHRRRWQAPALIGAAALIVVLGLGTWILSSGSGGGDDGESVSAGEVTPPRLGLPTLSSWEVVGAIELPGTGGASPRGQFTYYGSSGTEDPFVDGDLLIAVLPVDEGSSLSVASPATDVTVRATTGQVYSGAAEGIPNDPTVLQWREEQPGAPALDVLLASQSLSDTELLAIAEDLIPAESSAGATFVPPDDFELDELATSSALPFGLVSAAMSNGPGSMIAYRPAGSERDDDVVTITSTTGPLDETTAAMSWWADEVSPVEVGGAEGLAVTLVFEADTTATARLIAWSPASNEVIILSALGDRSIDDLVELSKAIEPLDDALWEAALAAGSALDASVDQYDVIYGQGDGTVGETPYRWTIGLQGDDLCFDVQTETGGIGSCQPSAQITVDAGTARTIDNGFGSTVADVVIAAAPDVESIRVTTGSGSLERVDAGDVSYFVYIGDPATQPAFDVIVGGEVVASLEAAVEEMAAAEPAAVDVAANPSAQAAGIVDDFEPIGSGGDSRVQWTLGQVGSDLCLVTDGESVSAGCFPTADITTFRPQALADGTERSYVVATRLPSCLEPIRVEPVDTVDTVGWVEIGTETGDVAFVLTIEGALEGRSLVLADSGGGELAVDIPDVEGSSGVNNSGEASAWPSGACS